MKLAKNATIDLSAQKRENKSTDFKSRDGNEIRLFKFFGFRWYFNPDLSYLYFLRD